MATTWYQPQYIWHATADTSTATTGIGNLPNTFTAATWTITTNTTDSGIYWGRINTNPVELTKEEIEKQKRWNRERKKAKKAARKLLMSILGKQQRREFVRYGRFHVYADGTWYRLSKNGTVARLESRDGPEVERYCIHIDVGVPLEDSIAAYTLMLMNDQGKLFLKTAHPYKVAA